MVTLTVKRVASGFFVLATALVCSADHFVPVDALGWPTGGFAATPGCPQAEQQWNAVRARIEALRDTPEGHGKSEMDLGLMALMSIGRQ
jgi:hypothetical protein